MSVNIPVEKINDFLGPRMQRDQDAERDARLRARFGNDNEAWDPEFSNLDTSTAQARAAAQKMREFLASQGTDPDRPLVFSITAANRSVSIQVRPPQDASGKWTCQMPCPIDGGWEWRTLFASSYDSLIGGINRVLSSAPTIRDLSEQERLELGLLAAQNPSEAFVRYMELRCGKESEALLQNPRFLPTYNDGVIFVFSHTHPSFPNTKEAIAHIHRFANGRPLTIPLCKAAFKAFQEHEESVERARLKGLTPEGEPLPERVGEAELQNASDKEIAQSLSGIRHAYAESERRRRDLIHAQPRTAEQAIRAVRGPSDYGEEL